MAIKKHEDIRLNVKPMFLTLYHEYVFEGPCRFGEGMQLEKEFDLHMAAEKFKGWYAQLQAAMPADVVNLLEPVKVERDEQFLTKDEMIEKLAEGSEDVDLYYIGYASRPYDLALEFAMRTGKPCAITQACCASAITSAEFLARGLEFYSFEDWADATEYMTVLRARKVLRDSKILAATRMTSTVSVSSPDSIIDPEKITAKFGTRLRYVSAHELLDQISYDDPKSNHCTPGRMGLNFDGEDAKGIDKLTDEIIDGADECQMTRDMVKKSVEAHWGIQKFLDYFECNCFTAPCPDLCATRRLNEKQFTMCLNHSLNHEQGIPAACEYDLGALISKLMLQAIGRRPSYMGNCFTSPIRNGVRAPLPKALFFTPEHVDEKTEELADAENVVLTFHSVPNRRWESFDEDFRPYAIREFARSGFGATFRYKFEADRGQTITMCRIDPTCEKLFVAKGTILTSMGYDQTNCSMGVFFQVKDSKDFFKKQAAIGNHMPLIYGDFEDQIIELGELLGLEIVNA